MAIDERDVVVKNLAALINIVTADGQINGVSSRISQLVMSAPSMGACSSLLKIFDITN